MSANDLTTEPAADEFNAARINSAIRHLNAMFPPTSQQTVANRAVEKIKSYGLTPEQNIIIELCRHIEALGAFLSPDKVAYRKDATKIFTALHAAADCHNRALGLGVHRGRGLV